MSPAKQPWAQDSASADLPAGTGKALHLCYIISVCNAPRPPPAHHPRMAALIQLVLCIGLTSCATSRLRACACTLICSAGFTNSSDLLSIVRAVQPTTLIGAASRGGAFTQPVIAAMSQAAERAATAQGADPHAAAPVIFALSNPTSKAECTYEQAYEWTGGRVVFASGTAFPPITVSACRYTANAHRSARSPVWCCVHMHAQLPSNHSERVC